MFTVAGTLEFMLLPDLPLQPEKKRITATMRPTASVQEIAILRMAEPPETLWEKAQNDAARQIPIL
jgi:hypothetical protein